MKKIEHMIQRGGRYHIKKRIPEEIRHFYDGKEFLKKSLKTADPRAAEKEVRRYLTLMDTQLEKTRGDVRWEELTKSLPEDQRRILTDVGGVDELLK